MIRMFMKSDDDYMNIFTFLLTCLLAYLPTCFTLLTYLLTFLLTYGLRLTLTVMLRWQWRCREIVLGHSTRSYSENKSIGNRRKILATSADPNPEHFYNLVLDHPAAVFKVRRYVGHHAQRPLSSQSIADRIQSQLTRRRRLPDSDPSTRLFPSNGPQAHNQGAY